MQHMLSISHSHDEVIATHTRTDSRGRFSIQGWHDCRWTGEAAVVVAKGLRKVKGDEKVHPTSLHAIQEPPPVKGESQAASKSFTYLTNNMGEEEFCKFIPLILCANISVAVL